jgi:hypothetical protein
MNYRMNRRGTVLMLVVGLLTMIAMLGSVFLISSIMDSQQTAALTVRSTGIKLSNGIASHIQEILKGDMYLGNTGPYSNIADLDGDDDGTSRNDRIMAWRAYIDYPSIDVDTWLSEFEQDEERWRSWVFGHPANTAVEGGTSVTQDALLCIDTDGNGQQDAYLSDLSVMDGSGQSYVMGVRIIDTSGLVCVNTGGDPETEPTVPYSPAMVDLRNALGEDAFEEIHNARSGQTGASLTRYWEDCGSRLMHPEGSFTPFSYADEAALRYLSPGSVNEQSRIFSILSNQGDTMRYLTTFSCSLSAMRHPAGDQAGQNQGRARVLLAEPNDLIEGNSVFKLIRLYVKFCGAIGELNEVAGGGGDEESGYIYDVTGSQVPGGILVTEGYLGTSYEAPAGMPPIQFAPGFPPAGTYTVSVRAPALPNYDPDVTVQLLINYAPALTEPWHWNQTLQDNQWIELGTITIPETPLPIMVIFTGSGGGLMVADAIRFSESQPGPEPGTPPACPEAAHVVANMWAYTSDSSADDEPFRFNPATDVADPAGWTAYGVVPQLVITEVFAWYQPESDPADTAVDDSQFVVAVELMNPYDPDDPFAEDISYEEYVVQCGSDVTVGDGYASGWSLKNNAPGDYALSPGQRIVLYYAGAGPQGTAPDPTVAGLSMGGGARWIECVQLQNFFTDGVAIMRYVGATRREVPVDSVHYDELGASTVAQGMWDIVRDDDLSRQRALVPVYVDRVDSNTVGTFNSLTESELSDPALIEVPEGFVIRREYGPPESVADLMNVFVVGPDSRGWDLPHKLLGRRYADDGTLELTDGGDVRRSYHTSLSRGTGHIGFINDDPVYYPDVPWGTLIQEFVEVVPPDEYDDRMPHMRVYGRININTAPEGVLGTLPFPDEITWEDEHGQTQTAAVVPGEVVEVILSYRDPDRDFSSVAPGRDPMYMQVDTNPLGGGAPLRRTDLVNLNLNISDPDNVEMDYMRQVSRCGGFLTPGEIAIPLAWYVDYLMGIDGDSESELRDQAGYIETRDSLYRAVANLITVNSTTFAATARNQRGTSSAASATRQVMVFDRGNCQGGSGDADDRYNERRFNQPAILLNVEVR